MNLLIVQKNRTNEVQKYNGLNIAALDFVIEIDGNHFKYLKDRRSGRNDSYSLSYLNDHLSQIQKYYTRQKFISDIVSLIDGDPEDNWKTVNSLVTEYERSSYGT